MSNVAAMDAMAAVDAPDLLARILPDALAATRRAYESAGNLDGLDDAEEAAAAGIVAWLDAARDHPPLRRQIASRLILSLEPWTGGGRYEEGGGARAIARVLRAAAADAHVEGGAEVRRLRGASRLLADARRYLVAGSPPARRSLSIRRGLRRDGNDGRNDDRNDDGDDGTTTSNSSERSAVEFEARPRATRFRFSTRYASRCRCATRRGRNPTGAEIKPPGRISERRVRQPPRRPGSTTRNTWSSFSAIVPTRVS